MTRRIGPVHFLKRPYAPHAAMALIAIAFSVAVMWIYLAGEIRGLLSWHVLPAAVFGIPHSVAKHGMTLLYETPGHVGWDGQFYYYIANDLKLGPGRSRISMRRPTATSASGWRWRPSSSRSSPFRIGSALSYIGARTFCSSQQDPGRWSAF